VRGDRVIEMIDTTQSGSRARRPIFGADVQKIVFGFVLIAVVLFGQQLYGMATMDRRLDASLRGATSPRNVTVILDFMPDRFHNERIQQYGAFAGRAGALNRLRLRDVTPDRLKALAAIPWVARIEPTK